MIPIGGEFYFHYNTVISTRAGNTTLFRLSTNEETCDCRNNVFYVTETGDRLALLNAEGVLNLRSCWFKPGYVSSHSGLTGTINDAGGHVTGTEPGFVGFSGQDFRLAEASACRGAAAALASGASSHPADRQYVKHRSFEARPPDGAPDLGAFEYGTAAPPAPDTFDVRPLVRAGAAKPPLDNRHQIYRIIYRFSEVIR